MKKFFSSRTSLIAIFSIVGILTSLVLRFAMHRPQTIFDIPLFAVIVVGGLPLLIDLLKKLYKLQFGSDLLAGISIVTALILGEYLAGAIIVLMLSGGQSLEDYALQSASSVLAALAKRMPSIAHLKEDSEVREIKLDEISIGDILLVYPHEICPVDGVVLSGHGVMDESFLTGEPFKITKTKGSSVISGSINGENVITIRAGKKASDSRYAKIMEVMRESESARPRLRRLGDRLGALYTPIALTVAILAWSFSGEADRFLSVLVIATPCPLLIGIPVAIIGSISLCARRAIIVKSPVVLEQINGCRTAIFDKTGTLTYGEPKLVEQFLAPGFLEDDVLALAASLEKYSKHPLSIAILNEAKNRNISLQDASDVSEPPGHGLRGIVKSKNVEITSRAKISKRNAEMAKGLPAHAGGLECIVLVDEKFAAVYRFRDAPRAESHSFVNHLGPKHQFSNTMIISGDRLSEVEYLAKVVGIQTVYAEKSPEEKLSIVREETKKSKTLYVGDGINDAPAMMAATVGMAMGQNSEVTSEAAGVVILDSSLKKVDEFMHISRRMTSIAKQSAIGGMALSVVGMAMAATGHLTPIGGAIGQEVIDVLAVMNALRAAFPPKTIHDL